MPKINSPQWNEKEGVCKKHYLPAIPCPQCMAEEDSEVEIVLDEMDLSILDFEPNTTAKDLLPADDADWLVERIRVVHGP